MEKIYAALAKFADLSKPIGKDANNPFFKSKYAPLDTIQETIKPWLKECGLVVIHSSAPDGMLTEVACAEDGSSKTSFFGYAQGKPQDQGSAITYGKRYNLVALLNLQICDEVEADYDGNRAQSLPKATRSDDNPVHATQVAKSAYKPDLAKAEYTGTHECTKCHEEVIGPDIFDGKYGKCFRCPHCDGFSKPNPKKSPAQNGVPTQEEIESVPF